MAQLWRDFHQARVSIARLGDILNTTPEPAFNASRAALPPASSDITFDHINFRYRIDGLLALHEHRSHSRRRVAFLCHQGIRVFLRNKTLHDARTRALTGSFKEIRCP
jgi:ABC-type multidrug transport system fused ATPase/permease subunit